MIEKLDIKNGGVEDLLNCIKKINEVVDAVNSLRDDCNLLMGYIAPENKCEPAENATVSKMENVPENTTNSKIESVDVDELVADYDRTRKALDVAVDALKDNLSQANFTQMLDASRFHCIRTKCEYALAEITALEQKDNK